MIHGRLVAIPPLGERNGSDWIWLVTNDPVLRAYTGSVPDQETQRLSEVVLSPPAAALFVERSRLGSVGNRLAEPAQPPARLLPEVSSRWRGG